MPKATIIEIPPAEQAQMLAEVRRARYGYLLALHILLLCAAQRTPTEIAAVVFCSRTPVYRVVQAYRTGQWDGLAVEESAPACARRRVTVLLAALPRSVVAILHSVPRRCGWSRTRWSCATIAVELYPRRQIAGSAETVRRWRHEVDWEWKRAKLSAQDEDPQRVEKLARIRCAFEQLRAGAAVFFADEVDIHLLPTGGYHWMPQGTQVEVRTPGTNEQRYLGGALELASGTITHWVWYRKTTGLFLALLDTLDRTHPAPLFTPRTVVADNAKIPQAEKVQKWLAAHARLELLYLPTYCPRANPIERACGDVHDKCTRNHTRTRLWHLVQDVTHHFQVNGPWRYTLSELYYTPEVTAAVATLRAAQTAPSEISQLAA
jgi:transposase